MTQPSDARISVHLVTWNSMAYLPSFFSTLDAQDVPYRTIVVDNASTDGVGAWLAERPDVTVLRNMRNVGFTRAHNQAIQMALSRWKDQSDLTYHYVFIVNPDIELDEQTLYTLASYMDAYPEIDACMPKILQARFRIDEAEQMQTERTDILDSAGLVMTRARRAFNRGAGEPDAGQYDAEPEIFGVDGAFCCFRASSVAALMTLGEFYDEDFHSYKEDVDLAWRMKRMGMNCAYVPQARVWHHRAAPSRSKSSVFSSFVQRKQKPAYINYFSTRNHTWMLTKHLAFSDVFVHAPWLLTYELGKLGAALFSWSSIKAYTAAIAGMPFMLTKRKQIAASVKLDARQLRSKLL